jgi:HSP20 family protein
VDVFTTPDEFIVQTPIAGLKPEDLDISIENDILIIQGRRNKMEEFSKADYIFKECFWGAFSKKIMLPEDVNPDSIQASMKEGVLTIKIQRTSKEAKRKIVVRS